MRILAFAFYFLAFFNSHSLSRMTGWGLYRPPLITFCCSIPCIVCRQLVNSTWQTLVFLRRSRGRFRWSPPATGRPERASIVEARCEREQYLRADEQVRTCPNTASCLVCICVARLSWCVQWTTSALLMKSYQSIARMRRWQESQNMWKASSFCSSDFNIVHVLSPYMTDLSRAL